MSLTNTIANGRTFLSNFSVPCLYIAVASLLAGIALGGMAMRRWDKGDIEEAKAAVLVEQNTLANLRAEMATQRADTLKQGQQMQADAQAVVARWLGDIRADLSQIPAQVAARVNSQFEQTFRSQNNAALSNCLDLPMPAASLRMLERPAGGEPGT